MDIFETKILDRDISVTIVKNNDLQSDVDIIIPMYKDRDMPRLAAKSFFRFENQLKMRIVFVDNSGNKSDFQDIKDIPYVLLSVPDQVFQLTEGAGKMSHSNAYALEVGRMFCHAPYTFVCHSDVLSYKQGWLSYLYKKMTDFMLAAFLRDNIRIKAAHVSGFLYNREFFDNAGVTFWPRNKPERDVGDDFSYYLQKQNMEYFVCPCSQNNNALLKSIHKRYKKLANITADKCLDDQGDVVYLHTGRGTVKMMGTYKKPNKTTYGEWIKFAKRVVGE